MSTAAPGKTSAGGSGGLFRFGLGPAIIAGAAWIIFWNEGGAAKIQARVAEGTSACVSVAADKIDSANEGKLVHVVGQVTTDEMLLDPLLQVSAQALRLKRVVEMYQWQEAESRIDNPAGPDGKSVPPTITYKHTQVWSSDAIDSSRFKETAGHTNPHLPLKSEEWSPKQARLGAFDLTAPQIAKLSAGTPLVLKEKQAQISLPPEQGSVFRTDEHLLIRPGAAAQGRTLTFAPSTSPPPTPSAELNDKPQVGDVRVKFVSGPPQEMTAIGKQVGNQIHPYPTKAGGDVGWFLTGKHAPEKLFASQLAWSSSGTWIMRAFALAVIYAGVFLTLGPLLRYANSFAWLQSVVSIGAFYVRAALTLAIAAVLIGAAWFYYRPAFAVALFVVAGLLFAGSLYLVWRFSRPAAR